MNDIFETIYWQKFVKEYIENNPVTLDERSIFMLSKAIANECKANYEIDLKSHEFVEIGNFKKYLKRNKRRTKRLEGEIQLLKDRMLHHESLGKTRDIISSLIDAKLNKLKKENNED